MRWPRVGMGNLERLGGALDEWFEREATPLWITEYAHEWAGNGAPTSSACATDVYGHSVLRTVRLGGPETIEVD